MSERDIRKKRASSAKQTTQRLRPNSANRVHQKIDFIQNMYGENIYKSRNKQPSLRVGLGLGDFAEINKSILKARQGYTCTQQLSEENIGLKKKINKLQQQLNIQKSKMEAMRKKTSEYTKKIGMQFEKQIYWKGSNADMVRGIKNQYQNIKQKYQMKCQQFDQATKDAVFAQTRQDKQYISSLEETNINLLRAIDDTKIFKRPEDNSKEISKLNYHRMELIKQNQYLAKKLDSCEGKNQNLKQRLSQRDKKIIFLEKLIVEKDNLQYNTRKKFKKMQKQKQEIEKKYNEYKIEQQQNYSTIEGKLKILTKTYQKQSESERQVFMNALDEKQQNIKKLEKEVAYLGTLLSYWKPIDQMNQKVAFSMIKEDEQIDVPLDYSMNSVFKLSQHPAMASKLMEQSQSKSYIEKRNRKNSGQGKKYDQMTKSIQIVVEQPKQKRERVTADQRYSEQGTKTRKVNRDDIEDICQTLKFRFIGRHLPIQRVPQRFTFIEEKQHPDEEDSEQSLWKMEYISMRQAKEILMGDIFGLQQEEATLLSRYLIEDCPKDYVYCDPNNENVRGIVKSIIKNLIGDYELPKDYQKVKSETSETLSKYETNLLSALNATASKGLITKKKLLQMFTGLGIELKAEMKDEIIGRLALISDDLNNLKYERLFDKS